MTPSNKKDRAASMVAASAPAGTSALGTAELKSFIASTRRDLQALSQSLSQALNENAACEPPPAAAPPIRTADSRHQGGEKPVSSPGVECSLSAETVASECHTSPASDSPTASHNDPVRHNNPVSDADPIDRLNAIKLRLAQQIQNAS